MAAYPNSGKLSPNRYKNEDPRKPDMVGEIIMERAALKSLLEEHDDDDIIIKLSGYNKQGNYGEFISIRWNNWKKKEDAPVKPKAEPIADEDMPF